MRFLAMTGLVFLAASSNAFAEEPVFTPHAFTIWGSMDGPVVSASLPKFQGQLSVDTPQGDETPEPTRAIIDFPSGLQAGSILVRTTERKLYFIEPDGKAIMYRVGVGREGFTWKGTNAITRKAEWPDWRPPKVMIAREAEHGHIIPDFMPGGPENPLGARALYIGTTDFRIHGTTQPWSIGHAVSSGCIRMLNADVVDLYGRAQLGATVVVE